MAAIVGEVAHWIRSCWEMCNALFPSQTFLQDKNLWSYDLGEYANGQFSMAVLKANAVIEDHSVVEISNGTMFVGVYDGHGGPTCSTFLRENLVSVFNDLANANRGMNEQVLTDTYDQMETAFLEIVEAEHEANPQIKAVGSCCLVGVIRNGVLFLANAGDSRVVLGRRKQCKMEAVALTRDDNARVQQVRDELRVTHPDTRIVFRNGAWRVRGVIQVTKAIGDVYLKDNKYNFEEGNYYHLPTPLTAGPVITAVPTVSRRELSFSDQFLVFASDGLWDFLTNEAVVEIVRRNPRKGIAKTLINHSMIAAAHHIGNTHQFIVSRGVTQRRTIHDDISVVVVFLDSRQIQVPKPVLIRGQEDDPLPGNLHFNF